MTKTVSARIDNRVHNDLMERCNRIGCNVNEFVGESVKFMLNNESDFNFGDEEIIDEEPNEIESEPKIFDCHDGNLYHDGNLFGKCADYNMREGKVYDDSGQYLGQTRGSLPKATVEIIES